MVSSSPPPDLAPSVMDITQIETILGNVGNFLNDCQLIAAIDQLSEQQSAIKNFSWWALPWFQYQETLLGCYTAISACSYELIKECHREKISLEVYWEWTNQAIGILTTLMNRLQHLEEQYKNFLAHYSNLVEKSPNISQLNSTELDNIKTKKKHLHDKINLYSTAFNHSDRLYRNLSDILGFNTDILKKDIIEAYQTPTKIPSDILCDQLDQSFKDRQINSDTALGLQGLLMQIPHFKNCHDPKFKKIMRERLVSYYTHPKESPKNFFGKIIHFFWFWMNLFFAKRKAEKLAHEILLQKSISPTPPQPYLIVSSTPTQNPSTLDPSPPAQSSFLEHNARSSQAKPR